MAINKESNIYTFGFSILLVVLVGAILSSLSLGLKPIKDKNASIKKKMDILMAIGQESDRSSAEELYGKFIGENTFVISAQGKKIEGEDAFNLDVQKQHRDKTISADARKYPVFEASTEEGKRFILPVVGKGLWGPIWGFVAIDENQKIVGASFDHKTETPGLGAEIKNTPFEAQYIGATIKEDIAVVKDGSGKEPGDQKVDGITGGTITSKGVEEMMNRTMKVYSTYFNN